MTKDNVLSHESRLGAAGFGRLRRSGESKIAHLEVAVGVEKQVGRLEIAMDYAGAVVSEESKNERGKRTRRSAWP